MPAALNNTAASSSTSAEQLAAHALATVMPHRATLTPTYIHAAPNGPASTSSHGKRLQQPKSQKSEAHRNGTQPVKKTASPSA